MSPRTRPDAGATDYGEQVTARVRARMDALRIPEAAVVRAAARAAEADPRFSEPHLRGEWLTERLSEDDGKHAAVVADPVGHYEAWLVDRLVDPFRVSPAVAARVAVRIGDAPFVLFSSVRWHQEIAWAQRGRASPDDLEATASALFLAAAYRKPAEAFEGAGGELPDALEDVVYVSSPAHDMSPEAIGASTSECPHVPLHLRWMRRVRGRELESLPPTALAATAATARKAERIEAAARVRSRLVEGLRSRPVTRSFSVQSLAVEMGLDGDDLVRLHEAFVRQVEDGSVTVGGSAHPVFLSWLRTRSPDTVAKARSIELTGRSTLPTPDPGPDHPGASDPDALREWRAETGVRALDPAVSYGMFLVRRADDLLLSSPERG